jgi:endonuclease G, mitochondrial
MFDNAKVREALARVASDDDELGEELRAQLDRPVREVALAPRRMERVRAPLTPETIVLRTGRPVLAIRNNDVVLEFRDSESKVWKQRLTNAREQIRKPILAVGRIDLVGHPDYSWVGTGWLVRPNILATNRHVAEVFARRSGDAFTFRLGIGRRAMSASIDFLREVDSEEQLAFRIQDVLHIEEDDGPDVALLRVAGLVNAHPIPLSMAEVSARQQIAVIGYPARDSRIPDQDLMEDLFGDVYDCKRLSPGQIKEVEEDALLHDCSTLGGNSGSVLLELASGKALGIHFAGRFLEANFAVPSRLIEERIQSVERPGARRAVKLAGKAGGSAVTVPQSQSHLQPGSDATRLECIIPLKVTVEVGAPVASGSQVAAVVPVAPAQPHDAGEGDDAEFVPEGVPADYLGREGYLADFLGRNIEIALPEIKRDADEIVTFDFDGNSRETALRYLHFSVVMHRTRRMCFYSAVNIDGNLSRKTKRTGWALDPRIPKELQIMKGCYGNPPKFSRGHMTRREDPAWGSSASVAQRGNADSMHVTNAVPQMQIFNAGIWLGLEDYALQNAREDDMKICVFTGPVFSKQDPVRFGVKVPKVFWKVIAFIHDATGKLSATGYSISQEKFLSEDEFVFGAYDTHQRSLRWIEQNAGVSFGKLTAHDLFEDAQEGFEKPLRNFSQIRFL